MGREMMTANQLRACAADCRYEALKERDEQIRATWLELVRGYEYLAEQQEQIRAQRSQAQQTQEENGE